MKINESNSLVSLSIAVASSPATRSARPQTVSHSTSNTELNLNAASQAAFAGRPERIAELRSQVSSGAYQPQTGKVAEKIVDEAQSRPD